MVKYYLSYYSYLVLATNNRPCYSLFIQFSNEPCVESIKIICSDCLLNVFLFDCCLVVLLCCCNCDDEWRTANVPPLWCSVNTHPHKMRRLVAMCMSFSARWLWVRYVRWPHDIYVYLEHNIIVATFIPLQYPSTNSSYYDIMIPQHIIMHSPVLWDNVDEFFFIRVARNILSFVLLVVCMLDEYFFCPKEGRSSLNIHIVPFFALLRQNLIAATKQHYCFSMNKQERCEDRSGVAIWIL